MKREQIRIRCNKETKARFKKLAADFKTYEDAIIAYIKIYNNYPDLFRMASVEIEPQVK